MAKATDLSRYEAKRDFQKTAEPRGADGVEPSEQLRFVVQKHDATRLHFDLRLELDGVFKSWAVTKGPSLNPSDKRLAVEVEDHPLGYGDFEGTIPKGQYGGGTVQLFDRGFWAPEQDKPPEQSLKDGELKFVLAGQRLKGSFVLVRMKNDKFGGKRTNWLLIKHRDDEANDADDGGGVLAIDKSVASGRAMAAIAEGKGKAPVSFMLGVDKAPAADAIWDSNHGLAKEERRASGRDKPEPTTAAPSPKAKLAAEAGKAAAKKSNAADTPAEPIPEFVAPQLCGTVDKPPAGAKWIHEIKFDGYRVQVRVEAGQAVLRTRRGLDWTTKFGAIAKAAAALPDGLYDGEIVALDGEGRPDFPALQAAIAAEKTDPLVFFAFDLLHVDGIDLRKIPLGERKARLSAVLDKRRTGKATVRFVDHFEVDGAALFASANELGLEGIVSKRLDSAYKSGRSDSWTKAKCRPAHEVVLGGWTDTGGKFRSLLGGVFRDGKLAFVGRIGTGFSANTVAAIMPKLEAAAREKTPFDRKTLPPDTRKAHWLEPTLVAEIEFAGWTGDGSLRQAAFKGLREDKPAGEVEAIAPTKQAVIEPVTASTAPAKPTKTKPTKAKAEASVAAKVKAPAKGKAEVMGVTISHPDKALWPEDGDDGVPVTKRDLALYFEAVGAWMLPHIADRPCSIIRAPDGIDGQTFFQRHAMAGGSKLFHTMEIAGDRAPYVSIDSVEALAAVAQSGGLELHPSNCAPGRPDVPGRLVFDLDPAPDVAFAEVIAAAKTVKQVLELLGLATFAKTTGGKGLHVVVPLVPAGSIDWDQAKGFAHDVCRAIERDAPTKYLTKQSKAARKGRIYLDYLRNDRLSTAVAPLSPRGRPHAPVSMPLTWAQVKNDLDPMRYTLRSVPALLKRSKAWADYDQAAEPVAAAIEKLGRL